MNLIKITAVASAVLLFTTAGCKKPASSSDGSDASVNYSQIGYTQIDPATAATVSGTIHFSGKMPAPVKIDMAQDPACNLGPDNYSEQYVGKGGGLGNVFIYVKDGLGNKAYIAPSTPMVIDQKGCRYIPHVVGVMAGQPIQFTNSDATMHNIHMVPTVGGNQPVDISQGPNGVPTQGVIAKPELMIPVRCNNHPWMQAFINVASNPFYAVSDENGHFEIKGLPPGTYTIVAKHEVLGEQTATVTVAAKQAASQDFSFAAK